MQEGKQNSRRHVRKIAAWPAWLKFHRSAGYVSRGGAYVVLPSANGRAPFAVGDSVDFLLGVPAEVGDHFVIEAVNGQAHVVRVERGADGGLALRFVEETDIEQQPRGARNGEAQ